MKYGHLAVGNGAWYILQSEDGHTWATIGTAVGLDHANLIVNALNERAAIHALRNDLEKQPEL